MHGGRVDFATLNACAIARSRVLLRQWLPDGVERAGEYIARNPRRADRRAGSFKVNVSSGRWADFATGDGGGDLISLFAYLRGLSQIDAARQLAAMLGIEDGR